MTTITSVRAKRALAASILVVAAVSLAGCSLLGNIIADNTTGDTGTDTSTGTDTDVFTIVVGDCLNDGSVEGEVTTVKTIPCSEPHDSEAYASIILEDGEFPGDQAVKDDAIAGCTTEFGAFVGIAYDDSKYDFSYYYPTEASWNGQNDREVLCLLVDPSGKVTGSLQGVAE